MLRTRTIGSLVVAATALLSTSLSLPATADAHGHYGGVHVGIGGFYGWGPFYGWGGWGAPYWGWGWGPGPYGYGSGDGLLGYAMVSGMGGLDVDVKPNRAEVWVDGKYVADARDLDGDPSYLWLKQGPHHVALYRAGFRTFEEDVDVRTGVLRSLKVQLEKGDSQPPARATAEAAPARPAEPRVETAAPRPQPAGGVRLRAIPGDATVYVDGAFRGTAREVDDLGLTPGHHRIELVRPGFRRWSRSSTWRPTGLSTWSCRWSGPEPRPSTTGPARALTGPRAFGHDPRSPMHCPKCSAENSPEASRCEAAATRSRSPCSR